MTLKQAFPDRISTSALVPRVVSRPKNVDGNRSGVSRRTSSSPESDCVC